MKNTKNIILFLLCICSILVGCGAYGDRRDAFGSGESSGNETDISETEGINITNKSKTNYSREYVCEVDGCYWEGTKKITGFSGETEYYCYDHYQEIQNIINMMEEDVGSGTASKHQCEECSKEGTHEFIGFSGEVEYYCTEHYNKLIEIMNKLYSDE